MPDQRTNHQRTHSLLLLQRLLSLKSGVSPFTVLLDTTEQSSRPVIQEFITRAKTSKTTTIYISFETLLPPKHTTYFIRANKLTLPQLHAEISSRISSPTSPPSAAAATAAVASASATLLILDTIHPILPLCNPSQSLSSFLTSLLPSPQISLLATYHTSIPLAPSFLGNVSAYSPSPLQLLTYLATTVIHVESFHHVLAEQRARERAEAVPVFGIELGVDGVVLGRGANVSAATRGSGSMLGVGAGQGLVVLRVEHRRKSGRGVGVDAVLSVSSDVEQGKRVMLLDEHPLYAPKHESMPDDKDDGLESTFNLTLTAKQRLDREGVVLPYFDAQNSNGPGEGGRIIYQMGNEDLGDWDEEEDEI